MALQAELAKLEAARTDIAKKERQHVVERRKFGEERKTLGEKLSRLEVLEKAQREAKLNPIDFMKATYGDGWYDVIVEAKMSGVPPANVIASEIAKVREEVTKQFTDRDAANAEANKAAAVKREQTARRELAYEAQEFWKANEKEYPIFRRLGDAAAIANTLAQRIETEYHRTSRRDATTGELLAQGRVITHKEAADLVESEILGLAEEAAAHDKYREKLRSKLQPPAPAPTAGGPKLQRTENQQRRTLSNDLTGSTPGRTPAVTPEDRRARAIAAFNQASRKP